MRGELRASEKICPRLLDKSDIVLFVSCVFRIVNFGNVKLFPDSKAVHYRIFSC